MRESVLSSADPCAQRTRMLGSVVRIHCLLRDSLSAQNRQGVSQAREELCRDSDYVIGRKVFTSER